MWTWTNWVLLSLFGESLRFSKGYPIYDLFELRHRALTATQFNNYQRTKQMTSTDKKTDLHTMESLGFRSMFSIIRHTHHIPISYPRSTHHLPIIYPLSTHHLRTVYPSSTHRLPNMYAPSTNCLRTVFPSSSLDPTYIPSRSSLHLRNIYGTSMEHPWNIHGTSTERLRYIYAPRLLEDFRYKEKTTSKMFTMFENVQKPRKVIKSDQMRSNVV